MQGCCFGGAGSSRGREAAPWTEHLGALVGGLHVRSVGKKEIIIHTIWDIYLVSKWKGGSTE